MELIIYLLEFSLEEGEEPGNVLGFADLAEELGLDDACQFKVESREVSQAFHLCVPIRFHLFRVRLCILELEQGKCINQIFDYCRAADQLWHQGRLGDVLQVVAQKLHLVESQQRLVVSTILGNSVDKFFHEAFECVGYHFTEDRVCENTLCDAIHGQDLHSKRGETSRGPSMAAESTHIGNIAEAKMLLEIVRLEQLYALLSYLLVQFAVLGGVDYA